MKEYTISITDDTKVNQLLALLRDLSYVRIIETDNKPLGKLPLMDNPLPVENFKRHGRDELYER